LKDIRLEIANVLILEICKTYDDYILEVDLKIAFMEATIAAFKDMDAQTTWRTISGIYARVRRTAIGIMLSLGPFNYPFNETYATLIPALLAGNVAILKIPSGCRTIC
jgi:glyceraldehyde-3-phosphate dehydrogenase (NADP+)